MMSMRGALIPMKGLAGAKMRLAPALSPGERTQLALAMLSDVIEACRACARFDIVTVVSSDSEIHWHARDLGARPLAEPATLSGLNDSLTFGQRYLARRVAVAELLIIPADLPFAQPGDIARVIDALAGQSAATIVRAADGGTNALAMRPAEALPMRFGAQSCDAHIAAARDASISIAELDLPRLRFDVDGPEDLDALASGIAGAATSAWLEARARYAAERP
jgi:2-phospho-L-lactate guanylyltransferase